MGSRRPRLEISFLRNLPTNPPNQMNDQIGTCQISFRGTEVQMSPASEGTFHLTFCKINFFRTSKLSFLMVQNV